MNVDYTQRLRKFIGHVITTATQQLKTSTQQLKRSRRRINIIVELISLELKEINCGHPKKETTIQF